MRTTRQPPQHAAAPAGRGLQPTRAFLALPHPPRTQSIIALERFQWVTGRERLSRGEDALISPGADPILKQSRARVVGERIRAAGVDAEHGLTALVRTRFASIQSASTARALSPPCDGCTQKPGAEQNQ